MRPIARTLGLVLWVAVLAGPAAAEEPPNPSEPVPVAREFRLGGDDVRARFVLDLTRKIEVVAFTLADPFRVVLDLPQVSFDLPAKAGRGRRGLIKAFRFGLVMQGASRIVLDVTGPVRVEKAFVLAAAEGEPARLVVDLAATDRDSFMRNLALEAKPAQVLDPLSWTGTLVVRPKPRTDGR